MIKILKTKEVVLADCYENYFSHMTQILNNSILDLETCTQIQNFGAFSKLIQNFRISRSSIKKEKEKIILQIHSYNFKDVADYSSLASNWSCFYF